MPAARGIVEHRQCARDVAGCGGALGLVEHGALALGADLADQERHTRVLRADGARLLGELLCAVQVMLLQQRLGFRHESVDDLLDTVQRARIARVAAQSLAVQIRGARARRCHSLTGGKRVVGACQ